MPRRPRISRGGLGYHILNRRVGRLALFDKPADYMAFEKILNEAHERIRIRIAAYCLMPHHWHLLPGPRQWVGWVNRAETASELEDLRCSAQRGRPFGSQGWVVRVAKRLSLESTLRPRGRPKAS